MGSLKGVQIMVSLYLEEQIIDVEEFRLLYEEYRKIGASLDFHQQSMKWGSYYKRVHP